MKRREAIGNLFAGLVAAGTAGRQGRQDDTLVARLAEPSLAGRSRTRVTDYENDPFVVGVEGKLRCTCGCNLSVYTCRTTDFTCETSPALHREVITLVEEGKTEAEILEAFMARYGETVLMSPPRRGFNLAAYVVPGLAILTAAGFLARHLVRQAGGRGSVVGGQGGGVAALTPDPRLPTPERAKLADQLQKLDL